MLYPHQLLCEIQESHAKRKDHGSNSRKAEAAEEVAELRIEILSATKNHEFPQHQQKAQAETADHFFRGKGAAAPALIALSLLNSAFSTFGSVRMPLLYTKTSALCEFACPTI